MSMGALQMVHCIFAENISTLKSKKSSGVEVHQVTHTGSCYALYDQNVEM